MCRLLVLLIPLAVWAVGASITTGTPDITHLTLPHLSAAQLRGLTTPVTRDRQLAAIRKGPQAMRNLLTTLGGGSGGITGSAASDPLAAWKTGIVMTPLAMGYGGGQGVNSAYCWTACASFQPGISLPTPASPVFYLFQDVNRHTLEVGFSPPAGGGYMITFNLLCGNEAPPQIVCNTGMGPIQDLAVTGDQVQPQASTTWTTLVTIPDQGSALLFVNYPLSVGGCWVWSGVTIRKL